jgi:hypothetical protein
MRVQKSKEIQRIARANDDPAIIRGSNWTGKCAAELRESNNTSPSTETSPKQGRTGNPAHKCVPKSCLLRKGAFASFRESSVRNRIRVGQAENIRIQVQRNAGQKASCLIAISMAVEHPTILCSTMQLRRLGPG